MKVLYTLLCLAIALAVILSSGECRKRRPRSKRIYIPCRPRTAVRYQLTVHTTWTRKSFPKMYPTYRPPAQWSALIGNSHSANFTLWKEGENATRGVRYFAETGDPRVLHQDVVQGYDGVLESFTAPAIRKGFGQTSTVVFADGGHTQMSFLMKIIPSPDWFIGVNGLDLCRRGRWKQEIHMNLRPMDAGTDQGLTFTSPNWPSEPMEPVSLITSQYPDHEASSFYYPELKTLPRIAYIDLKLVSEYRLRRTVGEIKDNRPPPVTETTRKPVTEPIYQAKDTTNSTSPGKQSTTDLSGMNNDPTIIDDEKKMATTEANSKMPPKKPSTKPVTTYPKLERLIEKPPVRPTLRELKTTEVEPTEPTSDISDQSILGAHFLGVELGDLEGEQEFHPEDCIVAGWSDWSPCTQTCGFGKKERSRDVIRFPLKPGAGCPPLRQETICGSMRSCDWNHFSKFSLLSRTQPGGNGGMRRRRRKPKRTRRDM